MSAFVVDHIEAIASVVLGFKRRNQRTQARGTTPARAWASRSLDSVLTPVRRPVVLSR